MMESRTYSKHAQKAALLLGKQIKILFNYGKSYLGRIGDKNPAVSLYEQELPLKQMFFPYLMD